MQMMSQKRTRMIETAMKKAKAERRKGRTARQTPEAVQKKKMMKLIGLTVKMEDATSDVQTKKMTNNAECSGLVAV